MKILVLADLNQDRLIQEFPQHTFEFRGYAADFHVLPQEELRRIIGAYEVVISEFDTLDRATLDLAEKLKLIICCRAGVRTVVDVPYAMQKGIVVRNTPGRNAGAVAEYVLGVLIAMDRKLPSANQAIHEGRLQREQYQKPAEYHDALWGMDAASPYHVFRGRGLRMLTLGVIGYGSTGREVVRYAVSLGVRVLVHEHHMGVTPLPAGVESVSMETLLSQSDVVSLHCDNREHRVLIGEKELSAMKQGAYFINTARGDLLDEEALIAALESGHLSGAALDVTRQEPLPIDSSLPQAPNLILTPHIAGATDEVIEIVTDAAVTHLREYCNRDTVL